MIPGFLAGLLDLEACVSRVRGVPFAIDGGRPSVEAACVTDWERGAARGQQENHPWAYVSSALGSKDSSM